MVLQSNKLRLDRITNIKIRLFINNFLSFKNKLLSLKSRFKKSRKKLSLIHPKRVRKIGTKKKDDSFSFYFLHIYLLDYNY